MRFIDLSGRRKDGLPGFAGDSVMKITSRPANHCEASHLSTGGHRIGNETRWRRGCNQPAYSTESPRLMPGAPADSAAPCIGLLRRGTPAPSRNHCDLLPENLLSIGFPLGFTGDHGLPIRVVGWNRLNAQDFYRPRFHRKPRPHRLGPIYKSS
jgi:hypothetical protein